MSKLQDLWDSPDIKNHMLAINLMYYTHGMSINTIADRILKNVHKMTALFDTNKFSTKEIMLEEFESKYKILKDINHFIFPVPENRKTIKAIRFDYDIIVPLHFLGLTVYCSVAYEEDNRNGNVLDIWYNGTLVLELESFTGIIYSIRDTKKAYKVRDKIKKAVKKHLYELLKGDSEYYRK